MTNSAPAANDSLKTTAGAVNSGFDRKYFPELDGLRALAAWLVVTYHLGVPGVPGAYGVVLFFVLSGFLITLLLLREHQSTGRINLKAFYARRTLRIMPAFYAFIAVVVALKLLRGHKLDVPSLVAASTYTLNYFEAFWSDRSTGFSHLWSLAVEEQFYLLWPFLFSVLVLRAHTIKRVGAVIAFIWIFRIVLRLFTQLPQSYFYTAFEMRADALLIGASMALLIHRKHPFAIALVNIRKQSAVFFLSIWAIAVLALLEHTFGTIFRDTTTAMLLPPLCGLLIISTLVMGGRGSLWGLNTPVVVWLGRISYSTYLYQELVYRFGAKALPNASAPVQLSIDMVSVLCMAIVSYYLIERPAIALKSRLSARRRTEPIVRATATL